MILSEIWSCVLRQNENLFWNHNHHIQVRAKVTIKLHYYKPIKVLYYLSQIIFCDVLSLACPRPSQVRPWASFGWPLAWAWVFVSQRPWPWLGWLYMLTDQHHGHSPISTLLSRVSISFCPRPLMPPIYWPLHCPWFGHIPSTAATTQPRPQWFRHEGLEQGRIGSGE